MNKQEINKQITVLRSRQQVIKQKIRRLTNLKEKYRIGECYKIGDMYYLVKKQNKTNPNKCTVDGVSFDSHTVRFDRNMTIDFTHENISRGRKATFNKLMRSARGRLNSLAKVYK